MYDTRILKQSSPFVDVLITALKLSPLFTEFSLFTPEFLFTCLYIIKYNKEFKITTLFGRIHFTKLE